MALKEAKKDIKRMVKHHLKNKGKKGYSKDGWPTDSTFWLMREVQAESGCELTPKQIRKIARKYWRKHH
jgi:hypothetical protein